LRARSEQLRAALRARRADEALRLVDELVTEARRIGAANTGTFLPEDDERRELEYLMTNGAAVRGILAHIDQNLRPIPGSSARIYRTEIPQGLYASVLGANPSATRREANPVESVTYAEAEAFALRFGWILGAKARLPTLAEYAAAAGDLSKAALPAQAWTVENAGGTDVRQVGTAEANASGAFDLIGNVEEWAQARPGETRAPVFGGSILTPRAAVLSPREVFKREKSRTLGFRIVIE
jgi:hypothetical protein